MTIEVIGLYQKHILNVEEYPFPLDISQNSLSELAEYLHSHFNTLHMCYLLVHAAMIICLLYQEKKGNIPVQRQKHMKTKLVFLRSLTIFIILVILTKDNLSLLEALYLHYK